MTEQQEAYLLHWLHSLPSSKRTEKLNEEIKNYGLTEADLNSELLKIENHFSNGIGNLNTNQLSNLISLAQQNAINQEEIKRRLTFYEVSKDYHDNIIRFLKNYIHSGESVDVGSLDLTFKGVQVASRDDFNKIINQGWTGDWDLNPDNIDIKRIQVASMNEVGPFPRGCYLNADIRDIQPINYNGKLRYRIFISNPVIINTGNRNVRFIAQPVRYIK